nr:MAG TPA: hypothetical protein [Caudoviricetes sp.]
MLSLIELLSQPLMPTNFLLYSTLIQIELLY